MAGLYAPPSQVQEQVQKELDEHVGGERPVRLSDRVGLTYLDCVINEGMRIRPVSPVLIPHTATTDSRYEPVIPEATAAPCWGSSSMQVREDDRSLL